MGTTVLFVCVLILVFNYSPRSDAQTPDASLKEHMKKIDEVLAQMESRSQAQDQKYSAILSNFLSQLTQTSHELGDLKTSHNVTILKLEEKEAEILDLWKSHNATVSELNELRTYHNNVLVDLSETRSKLQNLEKRQDPIGNVGFYAKLQRSKTVAVNRPIIFDPVLNNMGASYDRHTGKFTVPMNGTFQIWLDLGYTNSRSGSGFNIHNDKAVIGEVYGPQRGPATVSFLSMQYLLQGESISITPKQVVYLESSTCNFGVVLLKAH